MIRRPPRSTQSRSSAASDVYKRQIHDRATGQDRRSGSRHETRSTTTDVSATTSCLLPGISGGDHAIDAGIRFRDTPWEQIDQTGGGAVAGIDLSLIHIS